MGRESNNYFKCETVLRPDVKYYKRKNIYCWSMQKKKKKIAPWQWPNFA